jgi:hypothetical protein
MQHVLKYKGAEVDMTYAIAKQCDNEWTRADVLEEIQKQKDKIDSFDKWLLKRVKK